MPTNIITVGLNKKVTPWLLDVIDHGQNEVHRNPQPTTIIWILVDDLANAKFASMDGSDPGFMWGEQPPAGIFTDPTLTTNGKHLEIVDNHSSGNSTGGPWVYKLRVVDGNVIYSTTSEYGRSDASSKDPVIINKDP